MALAQGSISEVLDRLAAGLVPAAESICEDLPDAAELRRLVVYLTAVQQFTIALANGDLSASLPFVRGLAAGSLKSLQASLKHLTWQTKQIAAGDFSQRVDFMGEFSEAFNTMVESLADSRGSLEVANLQLQEDNVKLRELAEALRESDERFRHIAENVSDVIWTLDRSMGHFTYISPSIASLRGLSSDEALAEPLEHAMTAESLALLRKTLAGGMTDAAAAGWAAELIEVEQICRDGRVINVEVVVSAVHDAEGRLKEFVGVSRDVTVRKRLEDQLKYQSTHDALTGLHNRAFWDAQLELVAQGRKFPVSLIVADLDGLKRVNDGSGHEAGDLLIKGAAAIFRQAFRGEDIVARIGGDEFAILLGETGQREALAAMARVRSCQDGYNAQHDGPAVSMSLGAATAASGEQVQAALREADELMYADKARRRR